MRPNESVELIIIAMVKLVSSPELVPVQEKSAHVSNKTIQNDIYGLNNNPGIGQTIKETQAGKSREREGERANN